MDGRAEYLRTFEHLLTDRFISVHYSIDREGVVHQHVRNSEVAWHAGIYPKDYHRVTWPLFQNRNPNYDTIGIELEDNYKNWSDDHKMPAVQLVALRELINFLFDEGVIFGIPTTGVNLIGHSHVDPKRRPYDPGDYFWEHYAPYLVQYAPIVVYPEFPPYEYEE